MIKVKVEKDKITITGHANYAEYEIANQYPKNVKIINREE